MENNKIVKTQMSLSFGSLSTILTIVFLVLKLCNIIQWKWVFVFLPVIISTGLGIIALLISSIALLVLHLIDKHDK